MRNKRLGNFRVGDYVGSWVSIAILLLFSTACIVLNFSWLFWVLSLVYEIFWIMELLIPHCEQFSINSDSITVFWGRKTKTIYLPEEITLIVSYADVCPPLSVRTAIGNQTHVLKDKFAVSILKKMPIEVTLDTLHRDRIKKYTNSSIRNVFDGYRYIYSFVCNQFLLDTLIANRKCFVIVPESLSKVISFESNNENMYIDIGH